MILVLKISLIVALLIALLRFKVDLALTVFAVTCLTILLFRVNLKESVITTGRILIARETWEMLAVIVLVQYIGAIQKSRNMYDQLIHSLNSLLRDRRVVAIVSPMIIGFLPMPGGALFSAPLVEASTREMKLKPAFNAFLNYWFRHDWELIWPLYVGLLIFQSMSKIPMRKIILFQSPFSLLHIATGLVVACSYFRRHGVGRAGPAKVAKRKRDTVRHFLAGTWPLMAIILFFFAFGAPLYLTVIGTAAVLSVLARIQGKEFLKFMFSQTILRSVLVIMAVLVFKEIIGISRAFDTLSAMHVSQGMIVLFIFLVSFTLGFLTGVNQAYIAIAFPVLLPLIQGQPNYFYLALYVYIIGFAGILFSPLHLCLVLTNEYFRAPMIEVYRYMAFPLGAMILLSTLLVLIL